jgi:stage III sporulation protein AE
MKRIIKFSAMAFAVLLLFAFAPVKSICAASPSVQSTTSTDAIIKEQQQKSGTSALNGQVPDSAKSNLASLGIDSADKNSLARFTPANLLKTVLSTFQSACKEPLKALAAVLGILLACALLGTLKNSIGEKSLKDVFNIVSALCIAVVILAPVVKNVSACANTIKSSADFMNAFLPVYSSLAVASGHPASAIATQSLLLVTSDALSGITSSTFIPMIDLYLAFCVVGAVSPGINISGIAAFIKTVVSWFIVLCLTIYTGILTVQGVIASAADNVTLKTAKFVVDGAIPVVGGAISDAMNTVISCAGLLKTVVGAYAIVVFILAYLPSVLACIIWLLVADLSLAICDVLGITGMAGLLKAVKEALKLILALVLTSALAMIISVSVMLLLGMGN